MQKVFLIHIIIYHVTAQNMAALHDKLFKNDITRLILTHYHQSFRYFLSLLYNEVDYLR